MDKLDKIYNVYRAEFELIKAQSEILLQAKSNGFNGELKESGYIVEQFVKDLLKKYLPIGYRICSGYIATVDLLSSNSNLVQHDVIIVDDRVPSIYKFSYGDVEIVPAEAVCGIIEVKRTLNKNVLEAAVAHLRNTYEHLEKCCNVKKSKKDSEINRFGPIANVCTTAPIYGVIALQHEESIVGYRNEIIESAEKDFLDIVWAVSTPYLRCLAIFDEKENEYFAQSTSREQKGYSCKHVCKGNSETDISKLFAMAISRMQTWVSNTSMDRIDSTKLQQYLGL